MKLTQVNKGYPYLELNKRKNLLSSRNAASIYPAKEAADYMFTGNGHYWLESAGRPCDDEIIVTYEHLYEPLWKSTPNPADLRPYIDEIRQLVLAGKAGETDSIIDKAQRDAGYDKLMNMDNRIVYPIGSPRVHKAFSLNLSSDFQGQIKDYIRWTDLNTGISTTHFSDDTGVYETKIGASFKQDYTVIEFSSLQEKLNLSAAIKLPGGPNLYGIPTMVNASHIWNIRDNSLILSMKYNPDFGSKGYIAIICFDAAKGELSFDSEGFSIKNGSRLSLYIKVLYFDKDFTFTTYEKHLSEFLKLDKSLANLEADNNEILKDKMNRSVLKIGREEDVYLSGEELLEKCHTEDELYPMMMEKLYDMGRFYQIVDTGDIPPMWGQHNINTNLQVCAGNNTGLFEEMDSYFRYYESKFEDFRTNARLLFNARGLLASVHCDPDSGLFYHFSKTYPHYCWTGCLGWIYNEFWGYYLCTNDKEFLRERVVPALIEIALFFEDYAKLRDREGKVIFVPSFSPEDPTPNPDYSTVTCKDINATRINSVMDIAICREVLNNLIEACRVLSIHEEDIPKWSKQLEDLPTYLVDEEGGLKEWAWESIEENYNHRHVSHHYDLWPGRAVTVDREPEIARAIKISNRKRGQQDDSAHGIIHRAFCSIRLKDKEEALQNLSQLINHGFVRRNLATAHFPYRGQFPDLQGAMPALLIEMCVYSEPGMIEFCPVINDSWQSGTIEGVWLYSFAKLEKLTWNEDKITAIVKSFKKQDIDFVRRNENVKFIVNGRAYESPNGRLKYSFEENETVTIELSVTPV